jgi:transcriptional regulator with XRE-family HTH domain
MNPRVTDLDRAIAKNIKALRAANQATTLEQVSGFLGITYQSYQRMERGGVSFRASTLHKLALFYGVPASRLLDGYDVAATPNHDCIASVAGMMAKMPRSLAETVVQYTMGLKRK